jgi:apolipoprotein N-acyltransferase
VALIREYTDQIGRLASRLNDAEPAGTDTAIVLPEKIGVLSDRAVPERDVMLQRAATRGGATVVVGIDRGSATVRRNEARVYAPGAASAMVYDKHHLIPGLEAVDEAGTSRLIVSRSSGDWGVEICKDMDFPALAREYARDGIALLLVPAWDFDVDGWLHSRMAILRGVEGGFAIARAAKQGRLSVTDNRGRVIEEAASNVAPFATLVTTLRAEHETTLYARFGNWFAWLCVAVVLAIAWRNRGARGPSTFGSRESLDNDVIARRRPSRTAE